MITEHTETHHHHTPRGEHGSGGATADEALLRRYCRQVITGLETGKFTYLAHPDLFRFVGEEAVYRRHMRDVVRFAKDADIPLEINLLGLGLNKHYPRRAFWELAAEEGCCCLLGLDAHTPEQVADLVPEQAALEMVQLLGLKLIPTLDLRPI